MPSDEVMLAAGLDRAFLGLTREWSGHTRAVYDYDRCVKVFMRRDKMTEEDAIEFMDFNVVGAYVGEATPLFVKRMKITMD
jgi:hypothetical protein